MQLGLFISVYLSVPFPSPLFSLSARFCRVFQDYSGLTLQERAESTLPIVTQDEKGLDQVEYLARGYFHSLDLDLTEIQAKMALYAPALQAATASVASYAARRTTEAIGSQSAVQAFFAYATGIADAYT